jgi:hypothetical protein
LSHKRAHVNGERHKARKSNCVYGTGEGDKYQHAQNMTPVFAGAI